MKKSLIAASASAVALAAMPVLGVFAEGETTGVTTGINTYTDTIQTTVSAACSFARTGSTATSKHPLGTWTSTNETYEADTTNPKIQYHDVLSTVNMTPGSAEATLGSSQFTVICNNYGGYQVTFTAEDLTLTDTSKTQTYSWNYTGTGTAASDGNSYWYATSNGTNAAYTRNGTGGATVTGGTAIKVQPSDMKPSGSSAATPAAGTDFTVTYNAKAEAKQDTGNYDADIVYTFAQL